MQSLVRWSEVPTMQMSKQLFNVNNIERLQQQGKEFAYKKNVFVFI
jgi:hypothetical protein